MYPKLRRKLKRGWAGEMAKKPRTGITPAQIQNIVKNSNANDVSAAFSLLGPIDNYTDLLDNTKPSNKAGSLSCCITSNSHGRELEVFFGS